MPVNEEKQRYVRAMQASATLLARILHEQRELFEVFFARGYNANGGTDPITDADILDTQVKASEVAEGITLAENLPKFLTGLPAFDSDYETTLSKLRTDL